MSESGSIQSSPSALNPQAHTFKPKTPRAYYSIPAPLVVESRTPARQGYLSRQRDLITHRTNRIRELHELRAVLRARHADLADNLLQDSSAAGALIFLNSIALIIFHLDREIYHAEIHLRGAR